MIETVSDARASRLSRNCSHNVRVGEDRGTASPGVLTKLLPTERLLFAGDVACAGTFSCAAEDASFRGGEPSTAHCVVFSQTPVWIQHDAGVRYVADPTVITFHNRGRAYRRWRIDGRGDRCRWLAYAEDVANDVVRRWDSAHADRHRDAPFRFQFTPAPAALYLRHHRFFQRVDAAADGLAIEETALRLLHSVAAHAYGAAPRGADAGAPHRDFDAVQHVRERIAASPAAAERLRALAARVELSPYQLCRAFSRVTGETLTAYRLRLRLLGSIDGVCAGDDLTSVALAWGFASHSHFTAAFHRAFGAAPSQVRGRRAARYLAAAAISRRRYR